ncbi:MAG TPA: hypothetical protein VIT89_09490 [Solirubrobacterales bacterium]
MKRLRRLRPDSKILRDSRESVLRALSLVVTDRRWAAPLSAMALGFGLFLGVAIGPGAAGTFADNAGSIVAVAGAEEEASEALETANHEGAAAEPEPQAPLPEPEAFEPALEEPLEPEPVAEPPAEEETPTAKPPAEEEEATEAQQLKGIVVHANPVAGSYAMTIAGGELVSVHTAKLPQAGEKLTVEASPLPNNTFAEEEREKAGTAKQASIRGVVTYVDPDPAAPAYVLSGRGSSILVQQPASPAPALPVLGTYATVGVGIEKAPAEIPPPPPVEPTPPEPAPCAPDPALQPAPEPTQILVQRTLKTEPEPATYFDLAGIVSAVCPATGQLLISADDTRASESDLLLTVPAKIKTAKLKVGDSLVATATVEEDGTLTLAGLASDEGKKGASSTSQAQGDLER